MQNHIIKSVIVAKNKEYLSEIIGQEINKNGITCDLNHIDVSQIKDMSTLSIGSKFNGNISKWRPMSLINKRGMFENSKLKTSNNLPYWADIDADFLPQAMNAYHLNKKIQTKLHSNSKTSSGAIKVSTTYIQDYIYCSCIVKNKVKSNQNEKNH